jgi:type VI secretion system protein ImpM
VSERALTSMSAGLFGKLPAKRDFIGMNASRQFLEAWEPWLQAGMAMSKQMLGDAWIETYNRAPIWRYWLGADFCGEAMIGAFMPSVDGVGRSFPLAIFVGKGDASLPPPELEPNDVWFEAAEAVLLDALEPGATQAYRREVGGLAGSGARAAKNRGRWFRRPGRRWRPRPRHRQ